MKTHDPPPCFDASLAVFPTRVVPLDRIVDLLEVPHGDGEVRIGKYRQAMAKGMRFPPVAVVRWRGRFFLADGHKRLAACRGLAVEEIVVEVWTARRWLVDQSRQLVRKSRQQLCLLWRSITDDAARRELRRLLLDTVAHWKRIAASAAVRRRSRRHTRR